MQGIMHLYIENAATYIQNRSTPSKTPLISRAEFELRVLTQLDFSALDTEYKLAWMSAILNGDMFESFWLSQKYSHDLADPQTQRYRTDQTLCSYIPPPVSSSKTPPVSTSKQLASSPPKLVSFKDPPVDRQRSSSYGPYDKADARDSFTELINMDLGPTEVAGSRKRKKTAKAMAMGGNDCETKTKGKKKTSTASKKSRMSMPALTDQDGQMSTPTVTQQAGPVSMPVVTEQDGQDAEKDGLDAAGDVQGVCSL